MSRILMTNMSFQIFNKQSTSCFFCSMMIKSLIRFENDFSHKSNFCEIFVNNFRRNFVDLLFVEKFILFFSKTFSSSCTCIEIVENAAMTERLKVNVFFFDDDFVNYL